MLESKKITLDDVREVFPLGVSFFSADGQPVFASSAFLDLLGESRERFEKEGKKIRSKLLSAQRREGETFAYALPDGRKKRFVLWRSWGPDIEAIEIEDRTGAWQEHSQILALTQRDALTGLLGREEFLLQADTLLRSLHRNLRSAALVVYNLEHYRLLTGKRSQEKADILLQHFAGFLGASLRESDLASRLSEDEFALFLPETDQEGAEYHTRKILDGFGRASEDGALHIAAGISLLEHGSTKNLHTLLEEADSALMSAKKGGKNFAFYQGKEAPEWPRRIFDAMREERLHLFGQKTTGAGEHLDLELFIEEGDKLLAPDFFLPALSSADIREALDHWTLTEALGIKRSPLRPVAVTLSPQTSIYDFSGLDDMIVFLREDDILADLQSSAQLMNAARARGAETGISGFGREGGPFSYLRFLPHGRIKVEEPLVSALLRGGDEEAIARATLDVAGAFASQIGATDLEGKREIQKAGSMEFGLQGPFISPAEKIL